MEDEMIILQSILNAKLEALKLIRRTFDESVYEKDAGELVRDMINLEWVNTSKTEIELLTEILQNRA